MKLLALFLFLGIAFCQSGPTNPESFNPESGNFNPEVRINKPQILNDRFQAFSMFGNIQDIQSPSFQENFEQFQKKFQKFYPTEEERIFRAQVYSQNLQEIKFLNIQYPNAVYMINKFADLTPNERKGLLGIPQYPKTTSQRRNLQGPLLPQRLIRTQKTDGEFIFGQGFRIPSFFQTLRVSLNYTTQGRVTPAKDQNPCGSCWAFAAIAQIESHILMEGGPSLDLSEQYALDCTSSYMSCGGGFPDQVLMKWGKDRESIPLESQQPYLKRKRTSAGVCLNTFNNNYLSLRKIRSISIHTYPNNELLKKILNRSGPVTILLYADQLTFLGNGIYSCPISPRPFRNHAVLLVGFDIDGNWIVKNSYGRDWGVNDGYFTLSKDANCGLTDVTEFHYEDETLPINPTTVRYYFRMFSQTSGADEYIYSIRQKGIELYTFGPTFKSGKISQFFDLDLPKGQETEIHLKAVKDYEYKIGGFEVQDQNRNILHRQLPGEILRVNNVPFVFCAGC